MRKINIPPWTQDRAAIRQYPWLDSDTECDVCVVGGGLTGVLCALRLAEDGDNVVLLTDGAVGYGATAGMMPCAEYDGGETLRTLSRKIGADNAIELMHLACDGLDGLERLCGELDGDTGFARRDCMLFTDDDNEVDALGREYIERRRAGFDCSFISRSAAQDIFGFAVSGAIMSKGLAAVFDPYRLIQLCALRAADSGARIFENTKVARIDTLEENSATVRSSRRSNFSDDYDNNIPWDGALSVETANHHTVRAKRVVVATGAAAADILDGISARRTVYMAVSRPIRNFYGWPGRCIIRSSSDPRITYCASPDDRICACGLSTPHMGGFSAGSAKRTGLQNRRFDELEAGAKYLFPDINTPTFAFGQTLRPPHTEDSMPIIGTPHGQPGCIFAVCFGSAGALLSEVASRIVCEMIHGQNPPELEMFSPQRKALAG